jgi:hypothetical protein
MSDEKCGISLVGSWKFYTVGDLFTKISVHFVLNYMLHYYVCAYFYGLFMCVCCVCIFIIILYEFVHL